MREGEKGAPSAEEIKHQLTMYRQDIANYHEGTGNMMEEDLKRAEREVEILKKQLAEMEGTE